MTDDYFSAWDQASWTDAEAQNKRLDDMDVPDYTLKPSHHYKPRVFWFTLPVTKRPEVVEGPKRNYNVKIMDASSGRDMLGNNYQQIRAEIDGHRVIVNKYDDDSYVVKAGNHAYKATGDNLDDVIDGVVS